jgi:hypothetical protein
MKPMELKTLAFFVAATLSCGAFAQGSSGQAGAAPPPTTTPTNPTPNPTPNPAPMTSPTAPQSGANPSMPQSPAQTASPATAGTTTNMTSNGQQVFASLDRTHKGYLNQQDVASNSFLAGNFQRCDTNGDGRLTQSEVSACMAPGH